MDTPSDDPPLTPDAVAAEMKLPASFVQYALSAGCPAAGGLLSCGDLIGWLTGNYNKVREAAGMSLLPEPEGLDDRAAARVQVVQAIVTISQFNASRTSNLAMREAHTGISRELLASLDRVPDEP